MSAAKHLDSKGLRDFQTDKRVLLLCALAVPIGAISARPQDHTLASGSSWCR